MLCVSLLLECIVHFPNGVNPVTEVADNRLNFFRISLRHLRGRDPIGSLIWLSGTELCDRIVDLGELFAVEEAEEFEILCEWSWMRR